MTSMGWWRPISHNKAKVYGIPGDLTWHGSAVYLHQFHPEPVRCGGALTVRLVWLFPDKVLQEHLVVLHEDPGGPQCRQHLVLVPLDLSWSKWENVWTLDLSFLKMRERVNHVPVKVRVWANQSHMLTGHQVSNKGRASPYLPLCLSGVCVYGAACRESWNTSCRSVTHWTRPGAETVWVSVLRAVYKPTNIRTYTCQEIQHKPILLIVFYFTVVINKS